MKLPRPAVAAFCALALVAPTVAAGEGRASDLPARVVAVGDIHGADSEVRSILRRVGLIDDGDRWVGGETTLVQTGDFTDRGTGTRAVMDLLMRLQREATAAGGAVIVLAGNHEAMNITFDNRDVLVNPEIYASFASPAAEKRRKQAWKEWTSWLRRQTVARGGAYSPPSKEAREAWMAAHPPGFFEYHEALSADGVYGAWIRTLPVAVRYGDVVFVHGGIDAGHAERTLDELNQRFRDDVGAFDRLRRELEDADIILPFFDWFEMREAVALHQRSPVGDKELALANRAAATLEELLRSLGSPSGPLWYRGYAPPPMGLPDEELEVLWRVLEARYGLQHVVAAHSPNGDFTIRTRLGGRVFLIDTGMLAPVYNGEPAALEIRDDSFVAVYVDRSAVLLPAADRELPEQVSAVSVPRLADGLAGRVSRALPAAAATSALPPRVLATPAGDPIPLADLDEIAAFLRSARVISRTPLERGKSGAERLELERDGLVLRAVFHSIDQRPETNPRNPFRLQDGSKWLYFRDSYRSQVAAYELSRVMGLDNVPPAVIREVEGVEGSVALWVEGGVDLEVWRQSESANPGSFYWHQQLHDMRVFDRLIHNTDRNTGNIFWTPDLHFWLIDHSRSFARDPALYRPELVQRCSRVLYEKIKSLDLERAAERLSPYLDRFDIRALDKRRQKLLRLIDERIGRLGAERVLFDLGVPPEAVRQSESAALRAVRPQPGEGAKIPTGIWRNGPGRARLASFG